MKVRRHNRLFNYHKAITQTCFDQSSGHHQVHHIESRNHRRLRTHIVNANGIPYVYAAFCDFVTLCDVPDDGHLNGRNLCIFQHSVMHPCKFKLSVLRQMLTGVVFRFNGTSCIACVSAVHILYELYTVKQQSASSPVTVDLEEKQKLNIQY